MNLKEKKFYDALENLFVGADIEGEGGYVNLLKIKSKYYKKVLEQFKKEVEEDPVITDSFKEEFFDKLYSFFEKYFSESGSVYFVKTANWQRVYEQVYTDNKDVVLFWKTHMLYYVKSDILFKNMNIEITDEQTGKNYSFYFDVGTLQNKKNNEKREIVFTFKETKKEDDKEIFIFNVSYSERGTKTKIDDIVKRTKISEEILEKAFRTFKKQTEVDFFINKNAKKFLEEQLDMYLHQILLAEENIFDQKRLDQLKTIQKFAKKIIAFISQFEDELVRIWNKPKFVLNSNYVITLDKLSDEIINKIANHPNLQDQVKEWIELGIVEEGFDFNNRDLEKYKYLPIDTKYFKDIELDILSLFDNLDEALDGRLIHSENYQALNTLSFKYNERIQCIYIDPPYNTNSSPIIYVNNYKHSSWLTLMQNRIEISKKLLKPNGINIVAIDDVELRYLITLLDNIFGQDNYITTITTECNPQGRVSNKVSKTTEFHILHAKNINNIQEIYVNKIGNKKPKPLKRTGTNSRREERPNRYYPILIKDNKIFMIQEEEYKNIYNATSKMFNDDFVEFIRQKYENLGYNFVLPIGENGEKLVWQRTFERVNKEKENYIVKDNSIFTPSFDKEIPKTLWKDSIFSNPEYGSEYLKHILGSSVFETPKSLHTIKQFFSIFDSKGVYLDYFGGSGTTAEAIIKLNQEDDGERKYIIVELGDHIYSVIIPRIKKICFTDKWQEGMAQDGQGVSQFFKYYELEQYEDVLRNMRYNDNIPTDLFDNKKAFEQYIFFADEKFSHVLEVNGDNLDVNFDKLYRNIDFAETISNLLGLPIKRITKISVILQDGDKEREIKTDYKNMSKEEKLEFIRLLRPLLWWGE